MSVFVDTKEVGRKDCCVSFFELARCVCASSSTSQMKESCSVCFSCSESNNSAEAEIGVIHFTTGCRLAVAEQVISQVWHLLDNRLRKQWRFCGDVVMLRLLAAGSR